MPALLHLEILLHIFLSICTLFSNNYSINLQSWQVLITSIRVKKKVYILNIAFFPLLLPGIVQDFSPLSVVFLSRIFISMMFIFLFVLNIYFCFLQYNLDRELKPLVEKIAMSVSAFHCSRGDTSEKKSKSKENFDLNILTHESLDIVTFRLGRSGHTVWTYGVSVWDLNLGSLFDYISICIKFVKCCFITPC